MTPSPLFIELPILWSQIAGFSKFIVRPHPCVSLADETSCIVPHQESLRVRPIRDWLDSEIRYYEMFGLFPAIETATHIDLDRRAFDHIAVATRFRFEKFDDKLLFALRWL
jgi:hypothetical protein